MWKYKLSYNLPASFGGGRWSEMVRGIKATRQRAEEVKAQGATRIKIGGKKLV